MQTSSINLIIVGVTLIILLLIEKIKPREQSKDENSEQKNITNGYIVGPNRQLGSNRYVMHPSECSGPTPLPRPPKNWREIEKNDKEVD